MPEIIMLVGLVIPDNTAITTFATLKKMGYHRLLNLRRKLYYKFTFDGDTKAFEKKISEVDILVNFNKNKVSFIKPGDEWPDKRTRILVKSLDDQGKALLQQLRNNFGLKKLKKIEMGTLWILAIDDKPENATPYAWEIARKLLYNKHYQAAEILKANAA